MNDRIQPGKIALGTLAYLAITFPFALVWHLFLFKDTYERLEYFSRKDPIVVLGFAAILVQGVILSFIYPFLCRGKSVIAGASTFALVMGGYHWTMHVLAAAAKHRIEPLTTWFGLETFYLAIQFIAGGFVLALIYRTSSKQAMPREAI
jgi:hypothetical protein